MIKSDVESGVKFEGRLPTLMAETTELFYYWKELEVLEKMETYADIVNIEEITKFVEAIKNACDCANVLRGEVMYAKDKTNA